MELLMVMLGLNVKWIYKWGLIGIGIKIAIIVICALLILLIIKLFGNRHGNKAGNSKEDLSGDVLTIKKMNKKMIAMCIAVPFLVIGILIGGVFALSSKYDFFYELTGSPGIYTARHENTKDSTWNVECTALTDGTLKKVINKDKKKLEKIYIDNKTQAGTLKMTVQQGDLKEEYNIDRGQMEIDMSSFSAETVRLAIEHKETKDIDISVKWK